MKSSRLISVCAFVLLVHAANAQSTGGTPMDADDFRAQSPGGGALQANPMMQQVIQQNLKGTATQQQLQAAQQQLQQATQPQTPKGPQPMWALGVSDKLCKDLMKPGTKTMGLEAEAWSQGFWTGLNMLDPRSHNVGKESDPQSIILDIAKHCTDNPDKTLMQSASEVYAQYLTAGK